MSKLDDETLLAYVDGQLDAQRTAEVEAHLARDPEARETVRVFRESAALLQGRFDGPSREPVPERLLDTVRDAPTDRARLLQFPDRHWIGSAQRIMPPLATAAGLVLAIGLGAAYLGLVPSGGEDDPQAAWQQVMETTASGTTVRWDARDTTREITPMITFRATDGRYCREYEQQVIRTDATHASTGIACREADGDWRVQVEIARSLLAEPPDDDDQYAPASGPGADGPSADPLTEIGSALGGDELLAPERERVLIENRWQTDEFRGPSTRE